MKFAFDNAYYPPAPSVEVELGAPDEAFRAGPLKALVDTGADATIIPFEIIQPLGLQIDDRKILRSQWGENRRVDIYLMDVGIGGMRFPLVEIIADEQGDEVILGRNILNKLILKLNGHRHLLEILG